MFNGFKYITIAVDASCSQKRENCNRTGFAYYIRSDSGTHKKAWWSEEMLTSSKAEAMALIEALKYIEPEMDKQTKVIVYADNMTVINIVRNTLTKSKHKWELQSRLIHDILDKAMSVEGRHVPAHTARDDEKKYYMNRWCDWNARSMKRHKRLHINKKPIKQGEMK